ncbi:MAG TPA: Hsp20/alpha crystallin family protein [Dehalococcoidia bacterium]|nr:Hsp20/alpha crystallin family protein [Dehalococcoidia bacterium]
MTMQRWDPFSEMQSLRQAMDRLFEDAWVRPGWGFGRGQQGGTMPMPIDVIEQDDNLIVKASLPGVKPDDIHITVQGNQLTIEGESRSEHGEAQGQGQGQTQAQGQRGMVHHQEHYYGRFVRSMTLPSRVNSEKAQASFENGMLTLTLPKEEAARTRQIPVSAGKGQPIEASSKPAIESGSHTGGNGSKSEQTERSGSRS